MKQNKDLLEKVIACLEDLKAQDISVLDVHKNTAVADYMIVATGTSKQHVNALSSNLLEKMKKSGHKVSNQADKIGEWDLIDLGDIIVHVMQQEIRDFYSLEKIWSTFENTRAE